jgi:hypothetical protein
MLSKVFIWTEALGCGEILGPCLNSYVAHHREPIHVYIYEEDARHIPVHQLIIPCVVTNQESRDGITQEMLQAAYKFGHRGTATLWAALIKNRDEELMIHLDSDSIFLADVVTSIIESLQKGYGVVGTRRPYKNQKNRRLNYSSIVHHLQADAVNTHCFGFNRMQITFDQKILPGLIEGQAKNRLIQRLFPVIDFFDRLTFYLRRKKGVFYLDSPVQSRSGFNDRSGPIESSMISFTAVGSGAAYYKNPSSATSVSYKNVAIRSFALFSSYLLGKQIEYPMLDDPNLVTQLERLDKSTWTLRDVIPKKSLE